MNKKVKIIISTGHNYAPSVKEGKPFISVDFDGNYYGGCSPCDNEEEVQLAVQRMKESILKARDIPIVIDEREKQADLFAFTENK